MLDSRLARRSRMGLVVALAFLVPAADALGQGSQQPCADEAHRQFDFWVGTWEVTNAQGNVAGTNRITTILGGCVLLEEWQSNGGPYSGKSLNIYDAANDKWHQTWVDNGGLLLELDGGLKDGNMVLEGHRPGEDGAEVMHRITWEPLEGGDVRQTWDTSTDEGQTWSTQFNGLYSQKG